MKDKSISFTLPPSTFLYGSSCYEITTVLSVWTPGWSNPGKTQLEKAMVPVCTGMPKLSFCWKIEATKLETAIISPTRLKSSCWHNGVPKVPFSSLDRLARVWPSMPSELTDCNLHFYDSCDYLANKWFHQFHNQWWTSKTTSTS